MTGLSEYRSKSAALLRIVTCAVIVLALLACDNGQPGTLTDNGEVMLTLRISLPTATDGSTATRAITSNEENAIDIAQLKVLVFKANSSTETFSYEAPQIQLQDEKYIVTLKQSLIGEKYRLVVIANAGKKLPVIPDNTAKKRCSENDNVRCHRNVECNRNDKLQPFSLCGEKRLQRKPSLLPHLWETSRCCVRWHA